ncbi:TonB-dependent receptor domain-containing protein [Brevundimonas sp.]|uniref:TonB-dependent receptor domain-containing protein n=1 Tax=Brevundimonas sp. TaxID=1871086 RepID=UPI0035B30C74
MTPGFEGSVAAVILALGLGVQSPAQAQAQARTPAAEAQDVLVLTVPSGDLSRALESLAAQSGIDLIYESGLVAGRTTPGLSARTTAAEALRRLLRDTGLVARRASPGVWILERSEATQLEEIVVTGTLLRGRGRVASPVVSLGPDDLDRRGHGSVADAIQALPQNFGSTTPATSLGNADPTGTNLTMSTGVNLRGFGEDATLVLVDGRRLSGTGSQGEFSDLSTIPLAAVERIDVLLDGASALYGSDAVGGVVNVILRDDFDGGESRLRLGASPGGAEDVLLSQLVGRRWSSGSALLAVEYRGQNPLNTLDRPYTETGDLRPYGGTDRRTTFASPGNVVVLDAAAGGYRSLWAIRPGADGVADTLEEFVAGETNLANQRYGADLIPSQTRTALYARANQALGPAVELSGDLRISQRDHTYGVLPHSALMTVTAANPYFVSLDGSTSHQIAYSLVNDVDQPQIKGSSRHWAASAGLDFDLPGRWRAEAYAVLGGERSDSNATAINSTFLSESLGTTPDNPDTPWSPAANAYFNPYGGGGVNDRETLDFITSGFTQRNYRSGVATLSGLVEGVLLDLPGGPVRIAAGAQWRREAFEALGVSLTSGLTPAVTIVPERAREVAAVFGELRLPLVSAANAGPGVERLELSLAGRAERYDDFGSTANPKLGALWSPLPGLDFRATWGASFRAPSLNELNEPTSIGPTIGREDGVVRLAVLLMGGNPDLGPETAESFTLGADWRPSSGPGVSLTLFETQFENRIARPISDNLSTALTDPSLALFVQRVSPATNPEDLALVESLINDPTFVTPGIFPASVYSAIFDGRWVNTGALDVRGVDVSVDWRIDSKVGVFDLDVSASRILDYERRITPEAPPSDLVGLLGFPVELTVRGAVSWTRGAWSTRLGVNHVDDYRDLSDRRVDSWTTADASLRWEGTGRWDGITGQIFVANIMDSDPPFVDQVSGFGFDARQADILGRTVSLQLSRRW